MSKVREIPYSEVGLETTEQAGARRGQSGTTVRKLVSEGKIPALVVGVGRTARYLVRPEDVDAVPVLKRGRPKIEAVEKNGPARKTKKTRSPKKSG